ncbi:hypothetical protein QQ045_018226 [Rhodiola kirilowii]
MVQFIRTRNRQKKGYFALKLDMSKADDRVEWEFLELIMFRLGFPESWIRCVMDAVMTVSYVVRINEMVTEEIWPERGIRQGDPLSSYLFLICTEWLISKLKDMQSKGKIKGIKICRGASEITHLLFADDSMIF